MSTDIRDICAAHERIRTEKIHTRFWRNLALLGWLTVIILAVSK